MNRNYLKFALIFSVVILIVGGGYYFFSPSVRYQRKVKKGMDQYEQTVKTYQQELKEDIYGGKAPEETLKMFVEVLRKENIELASKFFFVDASGDRSKWVNGLKKAQEEGRLQGIVDVLEKAKIAPDLNGADQNSVWFIVVDENGESLADINLVFNQFASIWKIKSL